MFVAGDGECKECGSVMWAITSDYLQRGLKSCLAQFGSQTFSFIFSSRIDVDLGRSPMWRMFTLMWLSAVLSHEFYVSQDDGCICFTWPVHSSTKCSVLPLKQNKWTACTFLQRVQLSHAGRWLCVCFCFFAQMELAELRLVLQISLMLTLGSNRQQEVFGVAKTSRSSEICLKKSLTSCKSCCFLNNQK